MTAYSIDPAAVSAVLRSTDALEQEFTRIVGPLPDSVADAAAGAGRSVPVTDALVRLLGAETRRIDGLRDRIGACVANASAAAEAYERGDEEMARDHQRAAARAEWPARRR